MLGMILFLYVLHVIGKYTPIMIEKGVCDDFGG